MTTHQDDPHTDRQEPLRREDDAAERPDPEEQDGGPGSHTEDASGGVTDDPASGGTPPE